MFLFILQSASQFSFYNIESVRLDRGKEIQGSIFSPSFEKRVLVFHLYLWQACPWCFILNILRPHQLSLYFLGDNWWICNNNQVFISLDNPTRVILCIWIWTLVVLHTDLRWIQLGKILLHWYTFCQLWGVKINIYINLLVNDIISKNGWSSFALVNERRYDTKIKNYSLCIPDAVARGPRA